MRSAPWLFVLLLCGASFAEEEGSALIRAEMYDSLPRIVERLGAGWSRFDEPYVRIVTDDPQALTPARRARLTRFVADTMDRLGIDDARRRALRRRPILYLFCSRIEDFRLFTGIDAEGVALLRQRMIVTNHFPHEHEIAHLLVGIAIESPSDLPPTLVANEVLLQEGLAGYLGGRHGMTSLALRQSAEMHMQGNVVDPSRFLGPIGQTLRSFDDEYFYSGAARFVEFLVEHWGMPRLLELYRLLACTQDELRLRPSGHVILQMEGNYGMRWSDIRRLFNEWRLAHRPGGPQLCAKPARGPDFWLALDARRVEFWSEGEDWIMHVEATEGYPEVLLRYGEASSRETDGQRFALRLQPNLFELRDLQQSRLLTQGRFDSQSDGRASGGARSFTVKVPRAELSDFDRRGDLQLWVAPRLRSGDEEASADSLD